ncbi:MULTISPECIES: hemagglutinin repeat-containing protein, partial [unclassified Bartonella]|uniref:hemagglutinin repeat-containing protein n=1 Tax=unclassified Bartonella TaxID=2645622 RepID=UPI0035D0A29B
YHLRTKNTKVDMQASHAVGSSIKSGGDTTVIAGQDGKPHDLSITGSSIAAEGKVGLKASNDVLINNAEDSSHREISSYTDGGFFGGSSSYYKTFGATQVVGSSIAGEKGIAIASGNNTEVVASMLVAGKAEETSGEKALGDQKKADITIHSGGKITIKGAQEHLDQQAQSSSSGFLHEKSSDTSQSHTTTVSSILGAMGNIITQSDKETTITASHLLSGQDINVSGESVTIDGMTDHHKSHSEEHEKSFAGVTGSVNVGILGTVKDVKDAAKRFGHGDTKHKIGNGLIAGLKGYDLYSKGKGLYNGMKGG